MPGQHRDEAASGYDAKVLLRLPSAVKDHLTDAALENKKSLNEEILSRLIQPATQEDFETEAYEGTYSIDVLMLRENDQVEDTGPRIELWRALRDVSRQWLAHELGLSVVMLKNWESGRDMLISEDIILRQLAWVDSQHPGMQRTAMSRRALAQERMAVRRNGESEEEVEIEWLPGSEGELWTNSQDHPLI